MQPLILSILFVFAVIALIGAANRTKTAAQVAKANQHRQETYALARRNGYEV